MKLIVEKYDYPNVLTKIINCNKLTLKFWIWWYKNKNYKVKIYEEHKEYRLSIKDKIYFTFQWNYTNRFFYLKDKIKKYQLEWFKRNEIELPKDFDKYIYTCTINELERLRSDKYE